MPTKKDPRSSKDKSISINGDVRDSNVFIGDNNTVNKTTIIQKFFNIFKSDAETLEQRNRRILLNHVENAWIKGVLDASLHGAALLDLGIKQDPEAVTQYPWTLKKESTDETLPAGTSMLEIFDSIGMGRSLLILGLPGSGKTTMLLELARGLIARAREDVTQPIPMVFNLASWMESKTLADWLAQELNNLYSVPRKTAPDWVKGNKLLLLLDGLDEVRQESRAKCVEAINEFRKQNGLTSLAVCSRSQDYADLNAKLSFEGAIVVQPLTQGQIAEFFNRFGDEMAGIKQALEKDNELREMAETPLFLSIMIMAYRDKRDVNILVSEGENLRRKILFDNYIRRIFEHRSKHPAFNEQEILSSLSWLASKMMAHNATPFLFENMQPNWISLNQNENEKMGKNIFGICFGIVFSLVFWSISHNMSTGIVSGIFFGYVGMWIFSITGYRFDKITMTHSLEWKWKEGIAGYFGGLFVGSCFSVVFIGICFWLLVWLSGVSLSNKQTTWLPLEVGGLGILFGLFLGLIIGVFNGVNAKLEDSMKYSGEKIYSSTKNFFILIIFIELILSILGGVVGFFRNNFISDLSIGAWLGLFVGIGVGLLYGGLPVIQHYVLRFRLTRHNLLPWRLVPFLDHCVDLIFLRRVGGGYIFVHRLLMEHFAEMCVESPTSKGN